MNGPKEIEIKLKINDLTGIQQRLRALGFQVEKPRVFEVNVLFDTHDRRLRAAGTLLRLRSVADRVVLTWKGPAEVSRFKSREEQETTVGSFEIGATILARLGFEPVFRYEKFRTEWRRDHEPGVVTVDETPIGQFLELEGPEVWIDGTATVLGFSHDQFLTVSYGRLFLEHCERHRLNLPNMVFETPQNESR